MAWQAALKLFWSKYGKAAVVWALKQIGGQKVLDLIEDQLNGVVTRRRAIHKARQTRDGRWGPILVEDRARFVVYSGETPVEIFPSIKGDVAQVTAAYNTDRLRSPDDVPSKEFGRWVERRWRQLRRDIDEGTETPSSAQVATESLREAVNDSQEAGGRALFHAMVDELPKLLDELTSAPAETVADHRNIPETPGIYLFSDDVNPVYVGQTRNLRSRLRQHTSPSARENQAALAWRIALRDASTAGHPVAGTRKELEADAEFGAYFRTAKQQIAAMQVRFIELEDPVSRTVFEVYAARALGTDEFNSWETH